MICSMFVKYCIHQWSSKRAILLPWGRKEKEGQKWRKGAITHETCKTFFFIFTWFWAEKWTPAAVKTFSGRGSDGDKQSTVRGQWHKKVWRTTGVHTKQKSKK